MNRAATIALAPFSLVYGAAVKIRAAFYRNGIFKTHRAGVPVISIGNITTGGTGKTPLVEWVATRLAARGHRVCVLTRGYRRANESRLVLVSDGEQIFATFEQAGDEALMLARSLLGKAAVVCDADRVAGARWSVETLKPDVLILDDAYQHRRIARDIDIVTIDATNPFGNGWLLPAGILREPVGSLRRAHCIVVTRADNAARLPLEETIGAVTNAQMFLSQTRIRRITALNSPELAIAHGTLLDQPFAAFCGVGNPAAFFQQLRDHGFTLRYAEAFRDHHEYSQTDLDRLTQRATDLGAKALITTAKDAVKLTRLRFALPCYVAEIEFEISNADKLLALIPAAIQTKSV